MIKKYLEELGELSGANYNGFQDSVDTAKMAMERGDFEAADQLLDEALDYLAAMERADAKIEFVKDNWLESEAKEEDDILDGWMIL